MYMFVCVYMCLHVCKVACVCSQVARCTHVYMSAYYTLDVMNSVHMYVYCIDVMNSG